MKLYTEEQVKDMLNGYGNFEDITPIELPSDEDIYNEAQSKKDNIKKLPFDSASFQFGAMWLKDKIQGGNK
jgi:hypothetical protein